MMMVVMDLVMMLGLRWLKIVTDDDDDDGWWYGDVHLFLMMVKGKWWRYMVLISGSGDRWEPLVMTVWKEPGDSIGCLSLVTYLVMLFMMVPGTDANSNGAVWWRMLLMPPADGTCDDGAGWHCLFIIPGVETYWYVHWWLLVKIQAGALPSCVVSCDGLVTVPGYAVWWLWQDLLHDWRAWWSYLVIQHANIT